MTVDIPGYKTLTVQNVICDYNGTIAINGNLIDGVKDIINSLSDEIKFYVITADTYGSVADELKDVQCELVKISNKNQAFAKLELLTTLGKDNTVCIGNGNNDRLMLKEAIIGIALLQEEGVCTKTVLESDILCNSITDALQYFTNPNRFIATLRT